MGLGHVSSLLKNKINSINSILTFYTITLLIITTIISPILFIPLNSASLNGSMDEFEILPEVRTTNKDLEPNNNFSTASKIVYDISGTTHIFNASVGASNDPQDFWKLDISNVGSANADKITIMLSLNETNAGPNGVYMVLYDADYHKLGSTDVAVELDPNYIQLIGQVKPVIYLEVKSNVPDTDFQYVLAIINETNKPNPVFTDDESFINSMKINITKGETFTGQYLDRTYDFADFYQFEVKKDQKLMIDLQISSNSKEDFDLFLFSAPDINSMVASSVNFNQNENIEYLTMDNGTYYLRVGIKNIVDEHLRNAGYYKLTCLGNLPPQWNASFSDVYIMLEDGPSLDIDLINAFYELNVDDIITIALWDPNAGPAGTWIDLDSVNSITLRNLTIHSQNDGSIELMVKPNKFGTDVVRIRATDDYPESYLFKNLKILIKPTNDPPILNGTNKWECGILTPSPDGTEISCDTGKTFDCIVTAYDPLDPGDKLIFSDNTDMFDINPNTGKIKFDAIYNYTGINHVNITVSDNGTPPASTTRQFKFIIHPSDNYPIVELLGIENNSIQVTLRPSFEWKLDNTAFDDSVVFYDFYLSTDFTLVQTLDKTSLVITLEEVTSWTFTELLNDETKYYWTVIPNNGQVRGICLNGIFNFEINLDEPIPAVDTIYPIDKQIITQQSVTLRWTLDFSGFDRVYYEVYIAESVEELSDSTPWMTDKTEYLVLNLYFAEDYYWRVIPKTDRVRGYENRSEINMFHVAKTLPMVKLESPVNRSIILPGEDITLRWNIEYSNANKVKCTIFWGPAPDLDLTTGIELDYERNYILSGLTKRTYYWKVIPYINGLRGAESTMWIFIIKDIEVPKANLTSPVNTTFYTEGDIEVVELNWHVEFAGKFDPSKVWFDVYLDNSTNDPNKMVKATTGIYKQTFFATVLPVEVGIVYYWYVIPYLEIEDGLLRGISSPSIATFTFGPKHIKYELSLDLETHELEVEPGTTKTVQFVVRNIGNVKATVDIYTDLESDGVAVINPLIELRTVVIDPSDRIILTVNIQVLINAEPKVYNLTLEIVVRESTIVKAQDTIIINVTSLKTIEPPVPEPRPLFEEYPVLWIVVVIILFIIGMFLYTKIKRHKLLEHVRREMIFNYVKENPGEHFRGIQKALGLEVGVLAHHINKLEREEFVKSRQDGKYRRFYPMDATINIKLILSELQERILNWIRNNPGITGKNIAMGLGVDNKLVNYHVTVLEKGGFIYTEPKGRERQCYSIQT